MSTEKPAAKATDKPEAKHEAKPKETTYRATYHGELCGNGPYGPGEEVKAGQFHEGQLAELHEAGLVYKDGEEPPVTGATKDNESKDK